MNPVVVQVANGNVFFIGVGMTVAAFALYIWAKKRWQIFLINIGWLLGIGLVVISAAPVSIWFYIFWIGVSCLIRRELKVWRPVQDKMAAVILFGIISLAFCALELPFHIAGTIPVLRRQTVYVVGDSISAGIEKKEKTWPNVLGDLSGLNVTNLARAGLTVDTAMDQTVRITSTNALVIVEIGGNDLLGDTSSQTFYVQLDKLLAKLKSKNDQVVMFELPLLPFWNNFGKDQRELAKKYGIVLIPKKFLVSVFAGNGNTVDGLHLSQKGHDELAAKVYGLMKISP